MNAIDEAKMDGLPYFEIKCDECGYVDVALHIGSSSFDFCEGSVELGTVVIDGVEYEDCPINHRTPTNFTVRELTGMYPNFAEFSRMARS